MPSRFLILARDAGSADALGIAASEVDAVIGRYIAWTERLAENGQLVSTEKLVDGTGRVMRGSGARSAVTDGPLAETKEIVGGFWVIEAESLDEVQQLCADHPHLDFGSLEIREVEPLG